MIIDPQQRNKEKQASREADDRALAAGELTIEQLNARNARFAFPDAVVDLRGARRLW